MSWIAHPAFAPLSRALLSLGNDMPPDAARLNAMLGLLPSSPRAGNDGVAVRFAPAHASKQKALDYERSIFDTGVVPLRPDDWHDAFNALCWIAWPRLKAAINALHSSAPDPVPAGDPHGRGPLRDVLTLLDESGVIVLSSDPSLSALLEGRQWKALFHDRRDDVILRMRFLVCGHALFDKLRSPYRSIAARALIVPVNADALDDRAADDINLHAFADELAAASLSALPRTVAFPVCAIPGWWPGNDRAAFYDDASVFRPPRPSIAVQRSSTVSHNACAPAVVSSSVDP